MEIIGIGGSSNVARFGNQDGDYDDGSTSGGRGRGRTRNIGIGGRRNVPRFGNQDGDYDNGSTSGGRGRDITGNIGIGGRSNVARFSNQGGDYDDGSITGGRGRTRNIGIGGRSNQKLRRGRGRSEHIGIGVGSNVAGFGNRNGDNVDGSRSLGRGHGRSGNVSRGRSGHIGNQDVDYDCDNGSISRGRGKGRSGNTCGRGSYNSFGCGNSDADYDNGTHGDTNDNATETSQHVHGSNLLQSIPNHQSQRPMLTLYYGGVWNTSRWKKKSAIARQNRLSEVDGQVSKHTTGSIIILQHKFKMEKQKKRPVSLLVAYEYTHTQEMTEALRNGTDEGSGDVTDEAVGSKTREYITRRSKRVADVVEADIEDEHGPDASQHLPNDFDL
nr:hypothetical protein [Tanacetum cinerariifolium]